MSEPVQVKKFEERVAELEALVRRLECGQGLLQRQFAGFETGIAVVRDLTVRLDETEKRIEVLTRSAAGVLETRAVALDDEAE